MIVGPRETGHGEGVKRVSLRGRKHAVLHYYILAFIGRKMLCNAFIATRGSIGWISG